MALIITQLTTDFYINKIPLGDELEKFKEVLNNIPDENLILKLEAQRKGNRSVGSGRDDYPIRAMWNAVIAGRYFHKGSISDLRRELDRNPTLRWVIGFDDYANKKHLVPPHSAFTNFKKTLYEFQDEVDAIFALQVFNKYTEIDGFGEDTAWDGKIIEGIANGKNKETTPDGRRDTDANWTAKQHFYIDRDGNEKVKKTNFFGYRAHILCDVKTELPIAFDLTLASNAEITVARNVFSELPYYIVNPMNTLAGDRGFDDTRFIKMIKGKEIVPLIDIRNQWKDGETTRQYKDTDLVYTYDGRVYKVDDNFNLIPLKYVGFDKARNALRYEDEVDGKKKVHRIDISYDERIFLPIARDSKKFKRLYNGRTSVERLNGRIDRDYGFENNTIRGKKKMKLELTLSFIIMHAVASRHVDRKETNYASLYN